MQVSYCDGIVAHTPQSRIRLASPPPGNGERVLVVEDEFLLRMMMTEYLEELNFQVIPALSGDEALEILDAGHEVDLLLTDIVMPGRVDGFELASRVRKRFPNIPVIYTSGYISLSANDLGGVKAPLLIKPTAPYELAEVVAFSLNQAAA